MMNFKQFVYSAEFYRQNHDTIPVASFKQAHNRARYFSSNVGEERLTGLPV
jgi:hypothetical protein